MEMYNYFKKVLPGPPLGRKQRLDLLERLLNTPVLNTAQYVIIQKCSVRKHFA